MGMRTARTLPAGCPPSCWSCASWRCFSSPGQGLHRPLCQGAPQENIPFAIAKAVVAIALEGISCDLLWYKQMKSCLCILETIKPIKVNLDSAMASIMKNIDPQKKSLFYPKDGFHPTKIHGLSKKQSPCDKTQTFKLWWNTKTQIVTNLKNTNCEKTLKTQILTKLKNSNCDQTQKPKLWQN